MVASCCAYSCSNSVSNTQGKSFHRFPLKNPQLLSRWVSAIHRDGFHPTPHSRICSDHFTESAYVDKPGSRTLKADAVPTQFAFPTHLLTNTTERRTLSRPTGPPEISASVSSIRSGSEHDHTYSTTLDRKLKLLQDNNEKLRRQVQTLKSRSRRQQARVSKLEELVTDLETRHLIDPQPAAVLKKCFDGTLLSVLNDEMANKDRTAHGRRYSQEVKQFAATLHYYSPQAYEYCRTVFTLPHISSIRNWLSNVDCKPGFLTNVLDACTQSGIQDFSLVIDSMSIKKQTCFSNGKFSGFCDYGSIIAEDSDQLCSEALVFLLVPLSFSSNQYPVGYFLVDKASSRVQAELVKTILHLTAERSLRIRSITCDGAAANQTMLTLLGCNLNPIDPEPYFKHPCMAHNVYATLDICHMMKLARNALAEGGQFYAADGDVVKWQYVEELAQLQDQIGLHFANKLSSHHIAWEKQKMKVKLAAQTLSRSVADALQYLCDSGETGFSGCEGTIKFIRQLDRAFDVLNSKSKYGKNWRSALRQDNIDDARLIYAEFSDYLLSLEDARHQALGYSRHKTYVIGFICKFHSVLMLAEELFTSGSLDYFPTFRVSQDYIETLFSKIRRMGGHNNNPTAQHFQAALRNLLTKQHIAASKSANCVSDFNTTLDVFSLEWSKRSASLNDTQLPSAEEFPHLEDLPGSDHTTHRLNITYYVAGYIVRTLTGKLKCCNCAEALVAHTPHHHVDHQYAECSSQSDSPFQKLKERGGLVWASEPVVTLLQRCEKVVSLFLTQQLISQPNALDKMLALCIRSVHEDRPMQLFHHDCEVVEGFLPHRHQLIRELCFRYCAIRFRHFSKLFNRVVVERRAGKDRNRLNRLAIFKNQ